MTGRQCKICKNIIFYRSRTILFWKGKEPWIWRSKVWCLRSSMSSHWKKKSKKMTDWYRVAAVAVNESVGVLKIINSLSANKLKRQAINDNVCGAHELSWDPLRQTWRYVCMWFPPSIRNLRILRTKFQPTYQLNSTKFHARYLWQIIQDLLGRARCFSYTR